MAAGLVVRRRLQRCDGEGLLVHHEVVIPVTKGKLDFGPWQQVYYAEFDGQRPKRVIIKVMGE